VTDEGELLKVSKKTETIEVRVSPELKEQVTEVSRQRGQSISTLIRLLLRREVSGSAEGVGTKEQIVSLAKSNRVMAFGMSAVAMIALAIGWNVVTQQDVAARADARVAFAEMDMNHDGVISREEHAAFTDMSGMKPGDLSDMKPGEAGETKMDSMSDMKMVEPGDMKMSDDYSDMAFPKACEDDFRSSPGDPLDDFAAVDTNGDGKVVYEELLDALVRKHTAAFKTHDANANNSLDRTEFMNSVVITVSRECEKALGEEFAGTGDNDLGFMYDTQLSFAVFDENRDEKVTLYEYLSNQPPHGSGFR
jgi:hypothetical protein